jgi:hypothetical protein
MRASRHLLPFAIAAIMLVSPLSVLAAHTRCLADEHACGRVVLVDSCCCRMLDTRGTDPATTQTLPSAPPVFLPMPDRAEAPPTPSALLRVPHYPPRAGKVSLNTLFATLLI